jgi:hypothetical protein
VVAQPAHGQDWVFFGDKGVPPGAEEEAIWNRAAELSPRALARRLSARPDGGLDERDLPVHQPYLAEVRSTGAETRAVSRWLNAVSVEATEEQMDRIASLPFVTAIQPVSRRMRIRDPQARDLEDLDYGSAAEQLGLIGVDGLHACGLSGEGVVVGVLDTGFTLEHQAFSHLAVQAQRDFVNDDDNTADQPGDPAGQHDHGTKVLSLLAGLDPGHYAGAAPQVTVILAKIDDLEVDEPYEDDWWVAGLEWIEAQGADLATGSIGYCVDCPPERMDGQTEPTTIAANVAIENGLILVNSAGNRGPDEMTINAPADADLLIAVGSTTVDAYVVRDSSRGPTWDGRIKPDVMAPGAGVWLVDPGTQDQYVQGSGTSYAAPLVAGVIAMLLEAYPGTTPAGMHALLTSTASQAEEPTSEYGWGLVSGPDAAGLYCTCEDKDQDGHFLESCGGDDCDDDNGAVHPGREEACTGVDDDCDGILLDGEVDQDGDGVLVCQGDCNDLDPGVHPGMEDECGDELDTNCDGEDPQCRVEGCGCTAVPASKGWFGLFLLWMIRLGFARHQDVDEK